MERRIAIAVGGTGGHVVPAQQIGRVLQKAGKVFYIGVGLKENRFFKKEDAIYTDIKGANFSKGICRGGWSILKGWIQAVRTLRKEKISYVIGFGSFHSLPVLLAAIVTRTPFFLVELNTIAGKVNRFFSFFAKGTLIHFEAAKHSLRGKTYISALHLQEEASIKDPKTFGFTNKLPILLVFGGSGGALAIDDLFLESLQEKEPIQVIHITRSREMVKKRYEELSITAYVKEFLWNIEEAWQVADLAICRSGAGSIRESILFETPAIFIPYPHAVNDHQTYNARFMEEVVQGGRFLAQKDLTKERLRNAIREMLESEENSLKRNALKEYKRAIPQKNIADKLIEILGEYEKRRVPLYRNWWRWNERFGTCPPAKRDKCCRK